MTNLLRDPLFHNLFEFRKEFDHIFQRFFSTPQLQEPFWPMTRWVPPVEAYIDNKMQKYFLRVALPGFKPEEIKLRVQGNVLSLSGEHKLEKEMEKLEYLHREMYFGEFERTLTLPEGVDTDRLTAEFKNGLLELTAPVITAVMPRQIEIKTLPEAKRVAI